MNQRQLETLQTFRRVQAFLFQYREALPQIWTSGVRRAFDEIVDRLAELAQSKAVHTKRSAGGTAGLAEALKNLRENHIEVVVAVVETMKEDTVLLRPICAPARDSSPEAMILAADALARVVQPYAEPLIRLGLEPDFIQQMRDAADAVQGAIDYRSRERVKVAGARKGIPHQFDRAMTHYRALARLVRKHAGANAEIVGEWRAARRLPSHQATALPNTPQLKALPPGSVDPPSP